MLLYRMSHSVIYSCKVIICMGDFIMRPQYFFDDKYQLVSYLMERFKNPTPLKIQKAMYFLWAFYAATYGNIDYSKESEFDEIKEYPKELFEAHFEAWRYGPVLDDVYSKYKNDDECIHQEINIKHDSMTDDVWSFIKDLVKQIDEVNDFGLVSRSHQDSAWRDVYNEGYLHTPMNNEAIKEDYINYVNEQSKI